MKDKPIKTIVMSRNGNEWSLNFASDFNDEEREPTTAELTLEALADICDLQAENVNAHDFVMSHRALAALLYQELGRAAATSMMLKIAGFEGLPGMTGVCGMGDAEKAQKILGVRLDGWHKWKLGK